MGVDSLYNLALYGKRKMTQFFLFLRVTVHYRRILLEVANPHAVVTCEIKLF